MKKIILFASVALGLGFASCTKEQVSNNLSNETAGGLTVTAAAPEKTKTTVDGLSVTWAALDHIRIWDGATGSAIPNTTPAAGTPAKGYSLFDIVGEGGGTTASFSGDLPQGNDAVIEGASGSGARMLYATYAPSTAYNSQMSANSCPLDLDQNQEQAVGSDVDGKYLYMWADPVEMSSLKPSETEITLKFQYLCAILDLNITGVPTGESVTNVTIHGDNSKEYTAGTNNTTAPFMKRMQVDRGSVRSALHFGDVTTTSYYVNDVSVTITGASPNSGVTAHIAIIPRDIMTDKDGNPICSPLPEGVNRDLTVTVTTTDGDNQHFYTFPKNNTNTRWSPGLRYTLKAGASRDHDFDLSDPSIQATLPDLPDFNPDDIAVSGSQITVLTAAGLKWVADSNTAAGGFQGYTLTLAAAADISATNPWIPIGTAAAPFLGTFDGANKAISGLFLDATPTTNGQGIGQGLFGFVGKSSAPVTNIENVNITADNTILALCTTATPVNNGTAQSACGALLGCGYNVSISGCSLTGDGATGTTIMYLNNVNSGALVGELNNSSIYDCHVYNALVKQGGSSGTGNLNPGNQSLLIGATSNKNGNDGAGASSAAGSMVYISGCSVVNSYYSGNQPLGVGGIVGMIENVAATILDCQVTGTTIYVSNASNANATNGWGGIVGTINGNTACAGSLITGCSTDGGALTVGPGPAGGICGTMQIAAAITNCSNNMSITASGSNAVNRAGGICGSIGNFNPSNSNYVAVSALIMGCVNKADVTGGAANQNHGVCGGICGLNTIGMIVGCKQAAGVIMAKAGNGAGVAGSIGDVAGICGLNAGVISACAVTGGNLAVAANNASNYPATINADIIANNGVMNGISGTVPVGQVRTSYYVNTIGLTVPSNFTGSSSTLNVASASDFALAWPGTSTAGWDDSAQPMNWATFAPAIPSMASWATPWADLGNQSTSTYPRLFAEPVIF